jgi:hypothetical protein
MPAYLSIVRWPKDCDEQSRTDILSAALGLAPIDARQKALLPTPFVAGRLAEEAAQRALESLRSHGIIACAPTDEQIAGVQKPRRIKRLTPAPDAPSPMYFAEFWYDEESRGLVTSDIALFIRAKIDRTTRRLDSSQQSSSGAAFALMGPTAAVFNAMNEEGPARTTRFKFTELLEIYLKDGTRFRIDGDKFGYELLGADKGYTDADNMDRVAVRLAAEAPRAIIDTGFATFRPPPGAVREHVQATSASVVRRRDETPAFDFYAAWVVYTYRALARRK